MAYIPTKHPVVISISEMRKLRLEMFKDHPRSMAKSQNQDQAQGSECQHLRPGHGADGSRERRRQGSPSDKLGGAWGGLQDVPGEVLRVLEETVGRRKL